MKQHVFERQTGARWQTFELMLAKLAKTDSTPTLEALDAADFPHLYRHICHDLALARDRHYSTYLIDRLNRLATLGHQYLYQSRRSQNAHLINFIAAEFPSLIRQHAKVFLLAMALFYVPLFGLGLLTYFLPETAYTVLNLEMMTEMEALYDPSQGKIGRTRESDTDFMMFGYYIKHNIAIGFQTFAWGIVFGLGAVFLLMFNGIIIGVVAGHLTVIGSGVTFYPFVIGHGAFELTAITLSGMAGLHLGFSLLAPGRRTRVHALQDAAKVSAKIIYGATAMFFIAAFIEAFWSSRADLPDGLKYTVGGILWLMVFSYLLLAGRQRGT